MHTLLLPFTVCGLNSHDPTETRKNYSRVYHYVCVYFLQRRDAVITALGYLGVSLESFGTILWTNQFNEALTYLHRMFTQEPAINTVNCTTAARRALALVPLLVAAWLCTHAPSPSAADSAVLADTVRALAITAKVYSLEVRHGYPSFVG